MRARSSLTDAVAALPAVEGLFKQLSSADYDLNDFDREKHLRAMTRLGFKRGVHRETSEAMLRGLLALAADNKAEAGRMLGVDRTRIGGYEKTGMPGDQLLYAQTMYGSEIQEASHEQRVARGYAEAAMTVREVLRMVDPPGVLRSIDVSLVFATLLEPDWEHAVAGEDQHAYPVARRAWETGHEWLEAAPESRTDLQCLRQLVRLRRDWLRLIQATVALHPLPLEKGTP